MSVFAAKALRDRAVIQADTAEKLGNVQDVVLDPAAGVVDGLLVTRGQSLLGGTSTFVPTSQIRAIGPDAILALIRASENNPPPDRPGSVRLSDLIGRKVVSQSGQLLGSVADVQIDDAGLRLVGYAMEDTSRSGTLKKVLFGRAGQSHEYVPADADLRVGPDAIVVPDDAVASVD